MTASARRSWLSIARRPVNVCVMSANGRTGNRTGKTNKQPLIAMVAGIAVAAAGAALFLDRKEAEPGGASAPAQEEPAAEAKESRSRAPRPRLTAPSAEPGDAPGAEPGGVSGAEPAGDGEYPVDLEALRAKMPDNLYWKHGAPTDDPLLLQQRAEEEERWNELFGEVQAGTATEEEIREYYDHKRRLSEDYLAFATAVLDEHRGELPERDEGLYELSQKLHRKRLEEIPRKIEEALARKREQDERRAAWSGQ